MLKIPDHVKNKLQYPNYEMAQIALLYNGDGTPILSAEDTPSDIGAVNIQFHYPDPHATKIELFNFDFPSNSDGLTVSLSLNGVIKLEYKSKIHTIKIKDPQDEEAITQAIEDSIASFFPEVLEFLK
jgi:hypothetical protein